MLIFVCLYFFKFVVFLFLVVSFLGGFVIWYFFGFGDDFVIDGCVVLVWIDVIGFGFGWVVYGGDLKGFCYLNVG